jgi:hypothetical protein
MTQPKNLSRPRPAWSMSNIGGGIVFSSFALVWCGFVGVFDGFLVWNALRQVRVISYATTTGTITQSLLKVERGSESDSYRPDVHYRYEVNGRTFEGSRIRYDSVGMGESHALATVSRYVWGQAVTVRYNPAAPDDAVLERGFEPANLLLVLFLMPFNAVALGFIAGTCAWLRSMRLGRPVLGVFFRDDGLGQRIRIYHSSPAIGALVAGGGAGFLSTFAHMLLSMLLPFEVALSLAWIATIGAIAFGWWYARKKYIEIRRDTLRGRIELRTADGLSYFIAQEELQPLQYSRRTTKDSDGETVERFPLSLPFFDPASQQERSLALPEQTTEDEAKHFVTWLNGVLGVDKVQQKQPGDGELNLV